MRKIAVIGLCVLTVCCLLGVSACNLIICKHEHCIWVKIQDASCEDIGYREYRCNDCGQKVKIEVSEPLGHAEQTVAAQASTCVKNGLTEGKVCSVCGKVLQEQQQLPLVEHSYTKGVCTVCGKREDTEGLVFAEITNKKGEVVAYSVVSIGDVKEENIVIPKLHNQMSVTRIGESAFANCDTLKSVKLPSSIAEIGQYAFSDCENLKTVQIEEGSQLKSLCAGAFLRCEKLEAIQIPAKVTIVAADCFSDCSRLQEVVFADDSKLQTIEANAFCKCIRLKTLSFGKNSVLEYIGKNAFWGCQSLAEVTIPQNVAEVDAFAFFGTKAVKNVNGVEYVDGWAVGCTDTPQTVRLDSLTRGIAGEAFGSCATLEEIILPETVVCIGKNAFGNCGALKSIYIPASVKRVCFSAFGGCSSLRNVTFANNSRLETVGNYAFINCVELQMFTFGTGSKVRSLGQGAFSNCKKLASIEIPQSVQTMGMQVFEKCPMLTVKCAAQQRPDSWHESWSGGCTVVWGADVK